jgi:hypothetical protein
MKIGNLGILTGIFFLIYGLFGVMGGVEGATINAASCSSSDVQGAIKSANDGDVILVPAGTCTWTSPVKVDSSNREIHLKGSGMDNTVINALIENALVVTGSDGKQWRVSDLKFTGGKGNAIIHIGGSSKNWRLDHVKFATSGESTRLINVSGYTFGVIDHCEVNGTTPSEFVTVDGDNWLSWTRPQTFGGSDAVYIEDNNISWTGKWEGRPVMDGEKGGRAVFRYNHVTNAKVGIHGYDTGRTASMLSIEVYNNEFYVTDSMSTWSSLGGMRGGTGVWHNNKWMLGKNVWLTNPNIWLSIHRAGNGSYGWNYGCDGKQVKMCSNVGIDWSWLGGDFVTDCVSDSDCPAGYGCKWKFCSESKMNLCEKDSDCPSGESCNGYVDGSGPNGYPCRQQPGFTSQMASAPIYSWNNTFTGSQLGSGNVNCSKSADQIQEKRDYFNNTPKPGYKPYIYPHPLINPDASVINPPKGFRIGQ